MCSYPLSFGWRGQRGTWWTGFPSARKRHHRRHYWYRGYRVHHSPASLPMHSGLLADGEEYVLVQHPMGLSVHAETYFHPQTANCWFMIMTALMHHGCRRILPPPPLLSGLRPSTESESHILNWWEKQELKKRGAIPTNPWCICPVVCWLFWTVVQVQ